MRFFKWMRPTTAADIRLQQLEDAERLTLEYTAHAEHYQAMANMYRDRVKRLVQDMTAADVVSPLSGEDLDVLRAMAAKPGAIIETDGKGWVKP